VKGSFVADASVANRVGSPGPCSALWPLEVANALTVLRRRRKLTLDEARTAIEIIRELPAVIDHEAAAMAFTRLVDLATQHDLTIYDATYIELAARRQLPLASNDTRMKQAAIRSGVAQWEADVSNK
jgi:predicted nucleic acid-binding protein